MEKRDDSNILVAMIEMDEGYFTIEISEKNLKPNNRDRMRHKIQGDEDVEKHGP